MGDSTTETVITTNSEGQKVTRSVTKTKVSAGVKDNREGEGVCVVCAPVLVCLCVCVCVEK